MSLRSRIAIAIAINLAMATILFALLDGFAGI